MERRGQRSKNLTRSASAGHRTGTAMPPAFVRLSLSAKSNTELKFNNLMCQLKEDGLRRAYQSLKSKAAGTDGITKTRYGVELETNLTELVTKLHRGSYRPAPARRVLIPKGNGKTRPIAISNLEDKIVQRAVADILSVLYEPLFVDSSLGFRPHKGCHTAMRKLYHTLKDGQRSWVVDVDIEKFFDSMNHEKMMEFLQRRIVDPRFLRLIRKLLRNGVMENGKAEVNDIGTPQGSAVSPILANIYLHYAMDEWIQANAIDHSVEMIRYADDVVFCCKSRHIAEQCLELVKEKLQDSYLRVNTEKTRIVEFGRTSGKVIDFLGFTFYWGRDIKGRQLLKLKTQPEKLRNKIRDFKDWIKTSRNKFRLNVLWKQAAAKMLGHYAYYGVTYNRKVGFFYWVCIGLLFKWLNRRSQKISMSWEKFQRRLKLYPLPKPWACNLLDLKQGVFHYAV